MVVNKHLLSDLTNMGLWTSELKNQVIYHNGSIQQIKGIPAELKSIYRLNFLKGICWQQGFVTFRMWVTMLNLINIILLVSNLHPWFIQQDCLGNQAKVPCWHGCWSRSIHWPEPESKHPHGSTQLRQTHITSFLHMVKGMDYGPSTCGGRHFGLIALSD